MGISEYHRKLRKYKRWRNKTRGGEYLSALRKRNPTYWAWLRIYSGLSQGDKREFLIGKPKGFMQALRAAPKSGIKDWINNVPRTPPREIRQEMANREKKFQGQGPF
jgi:hypothetical protein